MHCRNLSGKLCLLMLCCSLCNWLKAQNIESPRFFTLNLQSFSPAQQLISQEGKVVSPSDDEPGILFSTKLLFPISLKGKTKLIGSIEYGRERLNGLHDITEGEDEELVFNKMGLSLIAKHKINDKLSYCAAFKIKNGAEELSFSTSEAYNFSSSHILQKKVTNGEIGLGVQIGYNQRLSILPIIKYEKELANNWKVDILLPSKALFYKTLSDMDRFYFGVRGSRGNYLLNQTNSINDASLYYRRLTVNAMFGYEKQLSGLLGVFMEAGASTPIRSGLFSVDQRWEEVHAYEESINPYVKFGVFLAIDK